MDVPACTRRLAGLELRYVLTCHVLESRSAITVGQLVQLIEADGFVVAGRASKTVSDALRWEIARGRVVRLGRGLYAPGSMPRQTKSRIRGRVTALRETVVAAA